MKNNHLGIQVVDQIVADGVKKGILHLNTGGDGVEGNVLQLKDRAVVNFGSCSYLGLEFDEKLIQGSISAIKKYGTQFSESRAYVSVQLYEQLEQLLEQIFGLPVVVTATTTLGHISAIPVVVGNNDAVLMDHQVHTSVQTAVTLLKPRGINVELVRHNRMDILEEKINILKNRYERIWYMADGIYSMFGDKCPVNDIERLLNTYNNFHFYVDDAHGMSIYGDKGQGYILSQLPFHKRMIVAASLNKAFASGGGVLVFPDRDMARLVRNCGSTLITSGPMQPSGLGAAIEAARIHLSGEITAMQQELHDNIRFANLMLKKYGLPLVSASDAAVFFIGVSLPRLGYNLVKRMLNRGYYLNLGIFPAVPMKNTGVRFTITRLHSFEQIENMVSTLAAEFREALREEGVTLEEIYRAFKMELPEELELNATVQSVITQSLELTASSHTSITEINRQEWDGIFAGKGNFDYAGLAMMEQVFTGNPLPEDNWKFNYFIVRDAEQRPVVAAFFTTALWKDDMLSPGEISEAVEQQRKANPYHLTSKVLSSGSLFSEGEHVYINRQSPLWKDAVSMMIQHLSELQSQNGSNSIVLRDFAAADLELASYMLNQGFFSIPMPDNHIIEQVSWSNRSDFYAQLSRESQRHFRKHVAKYEPYYSISFNEPLTPALTAQCYSLYRRVKEKNLSLNTFMLPPGLFHAIGKTPGWDVMIVRLHDGAGNPCCNNEPVAFVFSYISASTYVPMIIGLNYDYLHTMGVYRQCLYQVALRAGMLKCKKVHLGFSAGIEKKKISAVPFAACAYVQVKDDYNMKELDNMMVLKAKRQAVAAGEAV